MKPWEQEYEQPIPAAPNLPAGTMRIPAEQQQAMDRAALAIRENELAANPNDRASRRDVENLRARVPAVKPWELEYEQPQPTRPVNTVNTVNTVGQELKRQGGLFLRNALSAVASPLAIPADAIGSAVNAMTGRETIPNQQRALQRALTAAGLPEPTPDRPVEQFTQSIAQSAPAFALPTSLGPQVLGNAVIGLSQAQPGSELKDAGIGGAFGAGGQVLGRALGGVVRPTADAKTLMERGVALTPGQAAGKGSVTKWVEEHAGNLPVASHFVRAAQQRAVADANVAAAHSVAKIVDDKIKLGQPPREAIEKTREAISKAYDASLDGASVETLEVQGELLNKLFQIGNDHPMITPQHAEHITRYVQNRFRNMPDTLTGENLKALDSQLGDHIRGLARGTGEERTAAKAWRGLQLEMRQIISKAQGDPDKVKKLTAANDAYRELLMLEKAMLPGNDVITPRRMRATIERMNDGKLPDTELGKIAGAMSATLPNVVPNSGTTERLLMTALPSLLMGGGAGAQSMGYDTLGTGLMAAGALGSRPGARFLTGSLAGQQALAEALRRSTPATVRALNRED